MKKNFVERTGYNSEDVAYFNQCGYSTPFAKVLSLRGFTKDNLASSIRYSIDDFYDPMLMHGMREAVSIIKQTISDGLSILIYGDYDADGLSASALLSLFFTHNGVENNVVIPKREDGYGLHVSNVVEALQQKQYGVVVTVDCGISNAEEIAQLKSMFGDSVQFVVTDHHEVPEILPDCVCVNPKLGYPFSYLSGSGVAYKLVEALSDRETAMRYADLAIIGTIADVMPMLDENRTLIKTGLANFKHKSLRKLAELSKVDCSKITATDIGMRIAPKINAAGRVGDPTVALSLLLACDRADTELANKLLELNERRREIMEKVFADAENACIQDNCFKDRLIFVKSENWQHGVVGIVAGKLKEAYNLPAVVMTKDGDNYVGSARGVDGLDLHKLFYNAQQYLVKFGGHKGSVGFTVATDNIDNLHHTLVQQMQSMPADIFEYTPCYDIALGEDGVTASDILKFSESIQPLMPSDEIKVYVKDYVRFCNCFGKNGEHIAFTLGCGLQVKGFYNFVQYLPALKSGAEVELVVTLSIDSYSGTVQGILSDIALCNSLHFEQLYHTVYFDCVSDRIWQYPSIDLDCAKKIVFAQEHVLCVFDSYTSFLNVTENVFDFPDTYKLLFFCGGSDGGNAVAIAPQKEFDYTMYDKVVLFCKDRGMGRNYGSNCYYVNIDIEDGLFGEIKLNRDICAKVYKSLKLKKHYETLDNVYDKYLMSQISYIEYRAVLAVLRQTKLLDGKTEMLNCSNKIELHDSAVFRSLS